MSDVLFTVSVGFVVAVTVSFENGFGFLGRSFRLDFGTCCRVGGRGNGVGGEVGVGMRGG